MLCCVVFAGGPSLCQVREQRILRLLDYLLHLRRRLRRAHLRPRRDEMRRRGWGLPPNLPADDPPLGPADALAHPCAELRPHPPTRQGRCGAATPGASDPGPVDKADQRLKTLALSSDTTVSHLNFNILNFCPQ